MNDARIESRTDRTKIREEIGTMHSAYNELVAQIGDSNWKVHSAIPQWTCGQLAWHLASGLSFIAGQIEGARDGKALNPPAFLVPVLFKANELRVRVASRKATPASVLRDFDAGLTRLLGVLDATDDEALARTATAFFGETRTIGAMFSRPTEHFAEHNADIRKAITSSPR